MIRIYMRFILMVLSTIFLFSCASEEEKQERRENAYDLSGGYKVRMTNGSEVDMDFVITNESGRHDIVIELDRLSNLTDKEINFLRGVQEDPSKVNSSFGNKLILGKGVTHNHPEGGENISDDFGESTRFYVCTEPLVTNHQTELKYCLKGEVKKQDKVMNGILFLSWTRKTEKVDSNGQSYVEYSFEQVDLSYHSDLNAVFYKQYLGSWYGEVFLLTNDIDKNIFSQIRIEEKNIEGKFILSPINANTFKYKGELFTWYDKESSGDILELRDPMYPAVQLVYVGQSGKRIVLIGQLWSLGDFTGTIALIEANVASELGTFRHKKR